MSRVTASVRYGAPENPEFRDATGYTVTLRYQGRQMTTPFYMGPALHHEPTAEDVLECLLSDASGIENTNGFEDWARDLGFDPDSRRAERIYQQTLRATEKLRHLLGADFERFLSADRNEAAS